MKPLITHQSPSVGSQDSLSENDLIEVQQVMETVNSYMTLEKQKNDYVKDVISAIKSCGSHKDIYLVVDHFQP